MLFPIYIFEQGTELPEDGTYYILGRDGLYLRRDYGLIKATVRVPEIAVLNEVTLGAELRLPPIPKELVRQAIHFFRAIYAELETEAVVLVFWGEERGTYKILPPEQTVARVGIDYDKSLRIPGHLLVGSIHAHADFSAFHSITDHGDEEHFDGLHITVGHLDEPTHDISCQVVVNGNRFPMPPEQYLEGISRVKNPIGDFFEEIATVFVVALGDPELRRSYRSALKLPRFKLELPETPALGPGFPLSWRQMVKKRPLTKGALLLTGDADSGAPHEAAEAAGEGGGGRGKYFAKEIG